MAEPCNMIPILKITGQIRINLSCSQTDTGKNPDTSMVARVIFIPILEFENNIVVDA